VWVAARKGLLKMGREATGKPTWTPPGTWLARLAEELRKGNTYLVEMFSADLWRKADRAALGPPRRNFGFGWICHQAAITKTPTNAPAIAQGGAGATAGQTGGSGQDRPPGPSWADLAAYWAGLADADRQRFLSQAAGAVPSIKLRPEIMTKLAQGLAWKNRESRVASRDSKDDAETRGPRDAANQRSPIGAEEASHG